MNTEIKKEIRKQVKELKDYLDAFSIELSDNKGLFVQVDYFTENNISKLMYFLELNDIFDGDWEPCGEYNAWCEIGNIEKLIETIDEYLEYHKINS